MRSALAKRAASFKAMTYAKSTQKSYSTHLKRYLQFCGLYGYQPVPATTEQLECYVAYLAISLSYASIKNYINIVRILHLNDGYDNPIQDNFGIKCVLNGVKRTKGSVSQKMLPITPAILTKLYHSLDLDTNVQDVMFWGACMLGFWGFLRKSNLFAPSSKGFDHNIHLSRQDISYSPKAKRILVNVHKSKTIQYKERELICVLPAVRGILCPVRAIISVLLATPTVGPQAPLFVLPTVTGWKPYLYHAFTTKLRTTLETVGIPSSDYASHSLRRGAATWAAHVGLEGDQIRCLGDWHSDAYLGYIDRTINDKHHLLTKMASAVPCS